MRRPCRDALRVAIVSNGTLQTRLSFPLSVRKGIESGSIPRWTRTRSLSNRRGKEGDGGMPRNRRGGGTITMNGPLRAWRSTPRGRFETISRRGYLSSFARFLHDTGPLSVGTGRGCICRTEGCICFVGVRASLGFSLRFEGVQPPQTWGVKGTGADGRGHFACFDAMFAIGAPRVQAPTRASTGVRRVRGRLGRT